MIDAIVARIYYKILTIDDISKIECTAICSLLLYVIVEPSVFHFQHPKILPDRAIDSIESFNDCCAWLEYAP